MYLRHRQCHYWRHVLHWLDITDRIRFRLCIQVYKCQHNMAPGYLVDLCWPVFSIDSHRHLQSANGGQLQVPQTRMSAYGARAFGHAGPSTWNVLLVSLKCSTHSPSTFRGQASQTFLLLDLLAHWVRLGLFTVYVIQKLLSCLSAKLWGLKITKTFINVYDNYGSVCRCVGERL